MKHFGILPSWIRVRAPDGAMVDRMYNLIRGLGLNTVCDAAFCPNRRECFSRGTATFMILGDTCTRNCTFCAVQHGEPRLLNPTEPDAVAEAVHRLGLRHAVITSVTRDDLPERGASHFAATVRAVKARNTLTTVEILVPDFGGCWESLRVSLTPPPEVLNHNLETVPRLYPEVRPKADYNRSLELLRQVRELTPHIQIKSGLMLGLGENFDEVVAVMQDLRRVSCDLLTLGQYLRPSPEHHAVVRFVSPGEFQVLKEIGLELGFKNVASGPLVRSSFQSEELFRNTA